VFGVNGFFPLLKDHGVETDRMKRMTELTGRGADMIVLDDPQKVDEALSETSRKATHTWFDNTLLCRLNDKTQGSIIMMQRLHRDDLVGHALKQGRWDVLSLPAIAEVDECHLIDGPLGRRFFTRMPGDALHRARESAKSLANTRHTISKFRFASQYQQNPISPGRVNAIDAERERRFSDAYQSNDQLTLGRLWHNRNTGAPGNNRRAGDELISRMGGHCRKT
jgi:hypothetical protein